MLSVAERKGGTVRVKALTRRRRVLRVGAEDVTRPPEIAGRIELPTPFTPAKPAFQASVARNLQRFVERARTSSDPRRSEATDAAVGLDLFDHPVASCPSLDAHMRALSRLRRLDREIIQLEREVGRRAKSLAAVFDRVLQMLEEWGYLDGWALTDRGEQLVRIYHESDLLIAEAIGEGLFGGLGPAALTGVLSGFVYEARNSGPDLEPWFPDPEAAAAAAQLAELALAVAADERSLGLPETRQPDWGFSGLAHGWAAGDDLDHLLGDDLPGGDFVRTTRQLLDLLRQLADAATAPGTADTARRAVDAVHRGVVAASSAIATAPDPPSDLTAATGDDRHAGAPTSDVGGLAGDPPS